ncbi:MAG: crosslink repair DNA glycosylase YcaQ family protein [Micropruina sp.]|uniref:DNA glycosylase AlkZ-like family protein n=1 Tax=Micropruina sp. TaxID=2737536 RepID=UPI0039E473A1
MEPHRLSRQDARRIAVRAQLLDADRPALVAEVVDELTVLNIDPTEAIAPSEDHILWSRLGGGYEHAQLQESVETDRTVFEYDGMYRAIADLPLYRALMRRPLRYQKPADWLAANDRFRGDVLALLRERGPLRTGEIPDTAQQPWGSTGWTNDRNVTILLELLVRLGEVAIVGRTGRERRWDLAERWYPADLPEVPDAEVDARRDERRLQSLGIARAKQTAVPLERMDVGAAGEPAVVDGVAGLWRVDPVGLDDLARPFEGRTALLSPFDRLVFDRARAMALFGFEYALEMYKPAAKRRWGYFALPILQGDALIGKLDAKADRRAGVLRVFRVHADGDWTSETAEAVRAEIGALAEWLGLEIDESEAAAER